jgi:hypothetical protein
MTTVHMLGGRARKEFFKPAEGDEVWGLNKCRFPWVPKWDRFFNLHKHENLKRYGYDVERDAEWVMAHPEMSFFTVDDWPELEHSRNNFIFPRRYMEQLLPGYRNNYHCGSFDWMVAFALTVQSITEIHIHGVSLTIDAGEPISARACLEYWLGVAEGRGVKVTVADDCDIFAFYHLVKSNLVYSYDDTPIFEDRTRDLKGEAPYKVGDAA